MQCISNDSQFTIYVLQLESGKYYVGKSRDPVKRITSHMESQGSAWTKTYPPEKIIEIKENAGAYEEDFKTIYYMGLYGIDNVRGGAFCEDELTNETIEVITKMLKGAQDVCYQCGKKEHFINDCPEHKKCYYCNDSGHLINDCSKIKRTIINKDPKSLLQLNKQIADVDRTCFKCGESGHISLDCPFIKHEFRVVNGCFNCNKIGHYIKECPEILCSNKYFKKKNRYMK